MKKLIGMTAVALLAGTAIAAAQAPAAGNKSEGAAPAPSMQRQAPAEKMAPAQQGAQAPAAKPAQTTGQMSQPAARGNDKPAAADNKAGASHDTKSASDAKPANANQNRAASDKDQKSGTAQNAQKPADQKAGTAAQTTQQKQQTSGQGAAGARGAANLSSEQKTKIKTVVREKVHAQPVTNVNFSISVGTRVPRDVHFYPVPVEVVEVYPEWRGYRLIVVGDQIIIIEPSSFEIVAII